MDRVTESLLTEFVDVHELTGKPQSAQFEHFAAFVTARRHYNGEVFDTDDIVVGDGGDTGVDSIAIFVNGSLVTDVETLEEHAELSGHFDVTFIFVQADRGAGFDGAKISSFGYGVEDFFSATPKLVRNQKVTDAAEIMNALYRQGTKFRPGNPVCRLFYVTTGTWTGDANLEARRSSVEADLRGMTIFREVEVACLGAQEIQSLYRQTKNAVSREFTFADRRLLPEIVGIKEAYIGFVPLSEFMAIVQDENGDLLQSIFSDNVRHWQEYAAPVNGEIKNTINSAHKDRFVLMNNGITIISQEMRTVRGDRLQIEDFQIVNGCQTAHVLHDQRGAATDDIKIPLRLIATTDKDVINSIIRATNRQTKVEEDQFFALTEFAEQLEAFFQAFPDANKLYYERRSKQYAKLPIQNTRIVAHRNLLGAVASMFLGVPHQTTRSYKSLKASVGREIFAKGHKLDPYYVAAFTLYRLEANFRSGRIDSKLKPARFHILLAARLLANAAPMPRMNANDMDRYCKVITSILWDAGKGDALIVHAARIVDAVAAGNFHRDNIRTQPFTEAVVAACKVETDRPANA